MTQQTMTKEIDAILEKYHHGEYDLIEVRKLIIIAHQQEVAKEREKAKKLVEGCKFLLEFLEKHRRYVSGLGAPIHLIKQSLTEYEKL